MEMNSRISALSSVKRAWLALRLWRAGARPASRGVSAPSLSPSLDVGELSDDEVTALLAELLNGPPRPGAAPPNGDGDIDIDLDINHLSDDEVTAMLEQLLGQNGGAS